MSETISAEEIGIKLFTISDSRHPDEDRSGKLMREKIKESPFNFFDHRIIREESGHIRETVRNALNEEGVRVVITSGGTGMSDRDRTIEELSPLLDKELPGFGELFRQLSYDQVGPRCVLSRALAGRCGKDVIITLPGSPDAVELALDEIILEVIHHLLEVIEQ